MESWIAVFHDDHLFINCVDLCFYLIYSEFAHFTLQLICVLIATKRDLDYWWYRILHVNCCVLFFLIAELQDTIHIENFTLVNFVHLWLDKQSALFSLFYWERYIFNSYAHDAVRFAWKLHFLMCTKVIWLRFTNWCRFPPTTHLCDPGILFQHFIWMP